MPEPGRAAAQTPKPPPSIEITAPKDVTDLRALNTALSALSEKVTACVKAGRTAEACQCGYPPELASVRKGYETLIKLHPDWKDQLLSYSYVNKEGTRHQRPTCSSQPATRA